MLTSLLLHFFRLNFSKLSFQRYSIIFEMISIYASYAIYFYTSKAFSLGNNVFGQENLNYFDFIVIAEVALYLPLYFIEAPIRNLKEAIDSKVLNTAILLRWSLLRILIALGFNDFLRVLWRVALSLIILWMFFETSLEFNHIKIGLLLIFTNLPFCLSLGMLLCALYLYLGRGLFIVGHINMLLSVLSGAFFPVSVFPEKLYLFVKTFIPLTSYLSGVRSYEVPNFSYFALVSWIALLVLSLHLLKIAFARYVRRGLIIHRF